MVLPPEWTDGVRWLARRLNRGQIRGYRVGRVWRMTEGDVTAMIDGYSNTVTRQDPPADSSIAGNLNTVADALSSRSRRRLRTVP